jgi:hypothetical protein
MTRRKCGKHARILVPAPEANLEQAADILADLIAEAVEVSLNRSGGTETHGPAYGEVELIEWLSRDKKTA